MLKGIKGIAGLTAAAFLVVAIAYAGYMSSQSQPADGQLATGNAAARIRVTLDPQEFQGNAREAYKVAERRSRAAGAIALLLRMRQVARPQEPARLLPRHARQPVRDLHGRGARCGADGQPGRADRTNPRRTARALRAARELSLVGLISAYIEHFTYLGLFVVLMLCGLGLPIPEDVALLAGGYLVHRGVTRYPITLAVSLLGVVAGDNSLFFLGRHFGSGLVRYFSIGRPGRAHQIERIEGFMQRHGHRAIFYARFLAGLRALVYLSAGSFGVRPAVFLLYDLLGALISVPIVVTLGYIFGKQLEMLVRYIGGFERLIVVVAVLSVAVYATRALVLHKTNEAVAKDRLAE